jgi:predicted RNA-binding protein YlxR (DUF448 family)
MPEVRMGRAGDDDDMNPRTCIVSREAGDAKDMIRFVLSPDGVVVPDVRQKLPGRGVWVTARREMVETAVRKRLFSRGLKAEAQAPADLAQQVDRLLEADALSALGLARKAGLIITGFGKVDAALRQGKVCLLLHASEAAPDGVRKLGQAIHAAGEPGGAPPVLAIFSSEQMDLALGGDNVVHAAALAGGASEFLLGRIERLAAYRN